MFSVYVHIPYCRRKCPYCDFNSYAAVAWPEDRYTEALQRELRHAARMEAWFGQQVATVFFGGGTPSLFSPESIGHVLDEIDDCFGIVSAAEITLEANPGTVERATLEGFRVAGVNRLSLGTQSFHDRHLSTLGRVHGAAEARAAVELARAARIDAVNVDLVFGIPGQSATEWAADLATAIGLQPDHVSAYGLTYEEGTPFHEARAGGRLQPVAEEDEATMFADAERLLGAAGYEHYEISNYARPGKACRHNLTYWRREPYLGIGAGAHSFAVSSPYGHRWANARPPEHYLELVGRQGHAIVTAEHLDREQAIAEFLFLGLRLLDGVACDAFSARFGAPLRLARPAVEQLVNSGLLVIAGGRLRLTRTGLLHADSVLSALL